MAVFVGGLLPIDVASRIGLRLGDKLIHAVAFAFMQVVLSRAMAFVWPGLRVRLVTVLGVLGSAALGGLLELFQAATPHRAAELADFVADTLGALIAGAVAWRLAHRGERGVDAT
jgi:VanZ family protein